MDLTKLTYLDRKILKKLRQKGMTINEGIQIIIHEIYYLGYKDRAVIRRAILIIGNEKRYLLECKIQTNKREKYYIYLK